MNLQTPEILLIFKVLGKNGDGWEVEVAILPQSLDLGIISFIGYSETTKVIKVVWFLRFALFVSRAANNDFLWKRFAVSMEVPLKHQSLFRSFLSNWIGFSLAVVIGFFLSPYVVHSLGNELYGFWTLVIAVTSQLMILDLGVRNAVVRYLAMYRSSQDAYASSRLLSNAALILGSVSLIGLLLLCYLSIFLETWFDVPPELLQAVKICFILMSIDAAIELALGVFDGTLAASERYDIMNGLNSARLLLNALGVVSVLELELGIVGLASVALTTRLLQRISTGYFALRSNPELRLGCSYLRTKELKQIAGYGLWAAVSVAAVRVIHQIDSLVVGIALSASAVTIYAVPVILVEYFRLLSQSTATVLTPRYSGLLAEGDLESCRLLLGKWLAYGQMLAVAIGLPLLVSGGSFILLWMGSGFKDSELILQVLVLPAFIVVPSLGFSNFLYATNEHQKFALVTGAEALVNLTLSLLLVGKLGLLGVALGTLIPSLVFRGVWLTRIGLKLSNLSVGEYISLCFIKPLPFALAYGLLLLALKVTIGMDTWLTFFVANGIGCMCFFVSVYFFYADREDRAYVSRRISARRNQG